MTKPEYVVSACLAGFPCRYDGTAYTVDYIKKLVEEGIAVPVCPEQLGGLPTPRTQCEIQETDGQKAVKGIDGFDYTEQFIAGAQTSLYITEKQGIKKAILKERSPSCGYGEIYDGTFSGKKIKGNGITAELLIKQGITVYTEITFNKNTN